MRVPRTPADHRQEAMVCNSLQDRVWEPRLGAVEEIARRSTDSLQEEIIEIVADLFCCKRFSEQNYWR